jgi:hypothetical protein
MPYKDPQRQRDYMREKMRERRGTRNRNMLMRSKRVYPSFTPHEIEESAPFIPINGAPVIPRVRPPGAENRSLRKELRAQYSALRALGYGDAEAQLQLMRAREEAQEKARARKEVSNYQRSVEGRVAAFLEPARRWLMQYSGCFTDADVGRKAREMAEHEQHMRQVPRLPDEWTRAQLPAHSRS